MVTQRAKYERRAAGMRGTAGEPARMEQRTKGPVPAEDLTAAAGAIRELIGPKRFRT